MIQSWRVGVVVLMMAAICCASHGRVRTEFTIEVLEVTDFTEDPLAIEEAGMLEKHARLLQSRVAALRRNPPREPAKQREHREKIRDLERKRSDVLRSMRLAERRISAGMCEIYGWDGVEKRVVIIECRGTQRSTARRLSAGMVVECTTQQMERTPEGLRITNGVRTAVGMSVVQALPPIWNPVPASVSRSVRLVQAPSTTNLTGGVRQELGKDREAWVRP